MPNPGDRDAKVGLIDRLFCGFQGAFCGILPASMVLLSALDKDSWSSILWTVLIALLIPIACGIFAAWQAPRLLAIYRTKWWSRLARIGVGVMGLAFLVFGIIFIWAQSMWLMGLFLIACGLWTLRISLTGKEETIFEWWRTNG